METAEQLADELIVRDLLTQFQARRVLDGQQETLDLGDNLVLDEIGSGGMGRVYLARHFAMDRLVAIKVLAPESRDASATRRFEREVRAAARLQHPNIGAAYDACLGDGEQFLVMEYVRGKNLEEIVHESGPFTIQNALNMISQAAAGLQFAHEKGVFTGTSSPPTCSLMTMAP